MAEHKAHGYTLIELMVVVTIIGILMLIAVASFALSTSRARAITCSANRRTMTRSIQVYYGDNGEYPTEISDLQSYVSNWGSASKCPSGPLLTYEAATHDVVCPVHGD
jgi:prepilin-type N-terminal cleavage/methylation domain-containing protein